MSVTMFVTCAALVVAIAALSTTWYLQSKRLGFDVKPPFDLLKAAPRYVREDLKVFAFDRRLEQPSGLEVILRNVGGKTISRNNFEKPLKILVFEARIEGVDCTPSDRATWFQSARYSNADECGVFPGTLNRREAVTIKFLLDGVPSRVEVHGSTAGQTRQVLNIRAVKRRRRRAFPIVFPASVFVLTAGINLAQHRSIHSAVVNGVIEGTVISIYALILWGLHIAGRADGGSAADKLVI